MMSFLLLLKINCHSQKYYFNYRYFDEHNSKSFLGMTTHFLSLNILSLQNVTMRVLELSERHTSKNIFTWPK